MYRKISGALSLLVAGALLAGCDQNTFMAKPPSKPQEYKWVAIISLVDGTDCAGAFRHVTIKIKDDLLTIFPYYGYQRLEYSADLKGLNADGSGKSQAKYDAEQDSIGIGKNGNFTFDAGVGPRHIKLTSRYDDYCKYSIDPI